MINGDSVCTVCISIPGAGSDKRARFSAGGAKIDRRHPGELLEHAVKVRAHREARKLADPLDAELGSSEKLLRIANAQMPQVLLECGAVLALEELRKVAGSKAALSCHFRQGERFGEVLVHERQCVAQA